MIKPTVGRVVWYWPDVFDTKTLGIAYNPGCGQPVAATIAYVWGDRMVNLSYVDHNGVQWSRTSVKLLQDGDVMPDCGFAQWMPYQKGQAAKTESLEFKVDVLTGQHPPHGQANDTDCPHAAPFRYCPQCVASPCPIGLAQQAGDGVSGD